MGAAQLPTELVEHILRSADSRTFLACRLVCRRWRDTADRLAQNPEVWKTFCERDFKCSYKSVAFKSSMSWYNVYRNIHLWSQIRRAVEKKELLMTFDDPRIRNIHIYKNILTVVFPIMINLYEINDLYLLKEIRGKYMDCQQNDHMIILWSENRILSLYGKIFLEREFELQNRLDVGLCNLYSLDNDRCYYLTKKNNLWECRWDGKTFIKTFLARYYRPQPLICLNAKFGKAYILACDGKVMKLVREEKRFIMHVHVQVPGGYIRTGSIVNTCDVIWCVNPINMEVQSHEEALYVRYPRLANVTAHCDMLIFVRTEGEIEIYHRDDITRCGLPVRSTFITNEESIVATDVHESVDEHVLYIATLSCVYKVAYRHDYLKEK